MATRGTIALEFADGSIGMVYSHWDNYPSHNGKILAKHYMDPFKVRQLIDLGNLSSLQSEIGVKHSFDDASGECKNMTTFYARDRDDLGQAAGFFTDFAHYQLGGEVGECWEEYNYLLRQVNGKPTWYVNGQTLESALAKGMVDDE